jgi:hypothetical protein
MWSAERIKRRAFSVPRSVAAMDGFESLYDAIVGLD